MKINHTLRAVCTQDRRFCRRALQVDFEVPVCSAGPSQQLDSDARYPMSETYLPCHSGGQASLHRQ
eukprot:3529559-Rhodomonas_salina.2